MVLDDPQYAALSATVSLGQINVIPSVCEKVGKYRLIWGTEINRR